MKKISLILTKLIFLLIIVEFSFCLGVYVRDITTIIQNTEGVEIDSITYQKLLYLIDNDVEEAKEILESRVSTQKIMLDGYNNMLVENNFLDFFILYVSKYQVWTIKLVFNKTDYIKHQRNWLDIRNSQKLKIEQSQQKIKN